MQKTWSILLALLAFTILLVLVWPAKKPAASPKRPADQPPAVTPATNGTGPAVPTEAKTTNAAAVSDDFLDPLRAAVSAKNQEAFDVAFKGLTDYINAHPEKLDAYIAVLESEKDENLLRAFAQALGASEVGLLDHEKMLETILRLAKDGSFEQRQHIMLNLMSKFGDIPDKAYETVVELSQKDPNSQVKTSAVALLGDWVQSFPKQSERLIQQIGDNFKNAVDDDVRAFSCQLLALHKTELPRELQVLLAQRLKTSNDPFLGDLIASALSAAPDEIRSDATSYLEGAFTKESGIESQRDRLVQLVCIGGKRVVPLLEKTGSGNSLVAEDARQYLALVNNGDPTPDDILMNRAERDAERKLKQEKLDQSKPQP